jgi:hypothetical protein
MKKVFFISVIVNFCFANTAVLFGQQSPPSWVGVYIGSAKEGISKQLMTEYQNTIIRYEAGNKIWWENIAERISATDRRRLEEIFQQMNLVQQSKQKVVFIKPSQPLKKVIPTKAQFNSWKNESTYGIWINGTKVSNNELNQYSNIDFEQVTVSKLYGAARRNKAYTHQVDLMTKSYYRNYSAATLASKNQMVFRG